MINPNNLIRGSVWLVDLDPTVGHEQAKKRPCLVISSDTYNHGRAGLAIILPITSKQRELYWHVTINPSEGGLEKVSYVICDQMRCVSLERFAPKCFGFIGDYTMQQIEERLKILLYFLPEK
ncbi:MAG: type II toxin-antitoxin system PemK/MazF family toxin [Candidatus Babeliales bacterium]|jgi:mRNA interferase MazF